MHVLIKYFDFLFVAPSTSSSTRTSIDGNSTPNNRNRELTANEKVVNNFTYVKYSVDSEFTHYRCLLTK